MLEATQHESNCFLTLTYDDKHIPADGSLDPKALQDFIKRLRKYAAEKFVNDDGEPIHIRYFAVGEYGDSTWRPHYHLCLFGFPSCRKFRSEYNSGGLKCCDRCEDVRRIWGYGNVYLGMLEDKSAQYVAGYTVKKMTMRTDARLLGRVPEFARMSLKPGIGATAMEDAASVILAERSLEGVEVSAISYGKTELPLGTYLTKRLRTLRGLAANSVVGSRRRKYDRWMPKDEEMQGLQMAARCSEEKPSVLDHYKEKNEGKFASVEAKFKINRGRKVL